MSSMDILVAYFYLTSTALGAYSASSVLPKAVVVVIAPLLQMLFPVIVGQGVADRKIKLLMGKIFGVTILIGGSACTLILITGDWTCGSTFGIKFCEISVLEILLVSVMPIVLLRTIIIVQFARGSDLMPLWLAPPIALYFLYAWFFPEGSEFHISITYAWSTIMMLVYYAGISLIASLKNH
jgi:hypothetical protein